MDRKKHIRRFALVMISAMVIGGLTGFFVGKYSHSIQLNDFIVRVTPAILCVVFVVIELVLLGITLVRYREGVKYFRLVNAEDETYFKLADKKIADVLTLTGLGIIIGMISIALLIPTMNYCDYPLSNGGISIAALLVIVCIGVYFLFIISTIVLQSRSIEMLKKIYPEKNGYFYEKKFQKIWLESCDENERRKIGEASLYAYQFTQKAIIWTLAGSILFSLVVPSAYLISFAVGMIGLMNNIAYAKKAAELEKEESKI